MPAEEDDGDELTDAVRLVLVKDPFVDAARLNVVVTRSEPTQWTAERDAWYVLGVKAVVSHIQLER